MKRDFDRDDLVQLQILWDQTYRDLAQLRPDLGATAYRRRLIKLSCVLARAGVSGADLAALRREAKARCWTEAA
ncbi:hypothetical protein ACFWBF_27605 [Streptomyces sp. NPDC060028]|uniref:hypothetical protein n=1 Tax=Streptomyces sp. NPDC060028 TaxID=3347041 RepID=UPI0036B49CC7